jgi:hypothetical protein
VERRRQRQMCIRDRVMTNGKYRLLEVN